MSILTKILSNSLPVLQKQFHQHHQLMSYRKIIYSLVGVTFAFIALDWGRTYYYLQIGKDLAPKAVSFERELEDPQYKILVMGDSTAVGTGTLNEGGSTAERLAQHYPKASIYNTGINGTITTELTEQFNKIKSEKFNLIVLQIGGNDIVYGTEIETLETEITKQIKSAQAQSDHVIVLTAGNVGAAPIWPTGIAWYFTKRTLEVRKIFMKVTNQLGVDYVDLYTESSKDPFIKNPKKYHSPDNFHPSSAGYGLWFEAMKPYLPKLD